jgi:hypothetical protein
MSHSHSTAALRRWRRAGWRAVVVLCGLLPFHAGGAVAQAPAYLSPDSVPVAWGEFAALVKSRFEQRIAADDPIANRFRDWLLKSQGTPEAAPAALIVRAWIAPDGGVERVSFAPLGNGRADQDLRALLVRGNVGKAPPRDMLQPIHLRFSLNLPT